MKRTEHIQEAVNGISMTAVEDRRFPVSLSKIGIFTSPLTQCLAMASSKTWSCRGVRIQQSRWKTMHSSTKATSTHRTILTGPSFGGNGVVMHFGPHDPIFPYRKKMHERPHTQTHTQIHIHTSPTKVHLHLISC